MPRKFLYSATTSIRSTGTKSELFFTRSVYLFMQLMMRGSPRESLLAEYSSKLTPNQRNETMRAFQSGEKRILISSDTIARGIDIPGITAVINYDIAKYAETFIHRSGRTARARGELAGNET